MTVALKKQLRERFRIRLRDRGLPASALADVNQSLVKFGELNARAKDFAFRYAVSPYQSYNQWANYYGVHFQTIQKYMNNPRVRDLIDEIRTDVRKYLIEMQNNLVREAMNQYAKIFKTPELDGPMLEAKRKAAKEVLAWSGIGTTLDEDGKTQSPVVSVNLNNPHAPVIANPQEITIDDIREDIVNLEKKQNLRILAEKYGAKE